MKKLTLTLIAIFALSTIAYAGPESVPSAGKEVQAMTQTSVDFYRAHEWDVGIWGAYIFSANPGRNNVADTDPFTPDTDPFVFDVGTGFFGEPQSQNPDERIILGQQSKDQLIGRDNAFGGGVDVKYFWSKYFGAGLEGLGIAAKTNFAGAELATLTVRYPMGRFAPYGWGGLGGLEGGGTLYHVFHEKHSYAGGFVANEQQFWTDDLVQNNHVRAIGQLGIGLEYRVTPRIGLMADFSWNFVFGTGSADTTRTFRETGSNVITFFGQPISTIPDNNTATGLKPAAGSDNQDFGLTRFGVTLSY
jgi:hypothetical protein